MAAVRPMTVTPTTVPAPAPPCGHGVPVLVLGARITGADVPELRRRVGLLLAGSAVHVLVCDVAAVLDPDLATIGALAMLQLTARRMGREVRLRRAAPELLDLLTLVGLREVVPRWARRTDSGLQPRWQAEEREQGRGVEEEHDPGDLAR